MKTVEIYGRDINGKPCKYCVAAKRLLEKSRVAYVYRDIANEFDRNELKSRFPSYTTVPQIFIGDRHIGGFIDLAKIPLTTLQQMIGD